MGMMSFLKEAGEKLFGKAEVKAAESAAAAAPTPEAVAALAETDQTLSELLGSYERYVVSGEINSTVADQAAIIDSLEKKYAGADGVATDRLDGLTVAHDDWWFNVRPSNTEPLLRLNAEGRDRATMERVRDEILTIIRSDS